MANLVLVLGQVDLIGMEAGVRPPGKADKAAQESAHAAAETMQVHHNLLPVLPAHLSRMCNPCPCQHTAALLPSHSSCLGQHLLGHRPSRPGQEEHDRGGPKGLQQQAIGRGDWHCRSSRADGSVCERDPWQGGMCRRRRRRPQRATTWWM